MREAEAPRPHAQSQGPEAVTGPQVGRWSKGRAPVSLARDRMSAHRPKGPGLIPVKGASVAGSIPGPGQGVSPSPSALLKTSGEVSS